MGRFRMPTYNWISPDGINWAKGTGTDIPPNGVGGFVAGGDRLVGFDSGRPPSSYTYDGVAWDGPHTALPILGEGAFGFCGDLWVMAAPTGNNSAWILTSSIPGRPLPQPPVVTISPAIRLSWQSESGRSDQIQASGDNQTWTDSGGLFVGDGTRLEWTAPASEVRQFFRVQAR